MKCGITRTREPIASIGTKKACGIGKRNHGGVRTVPLAVNSAEAGQKPRVNLALRFVCRGVSDTTGIRGDGIAPVAVEGHREGEWSRPSGCHLQLGGDIACGIADSGAQSRPVRVAYKHQMRGV